MAVPLLMLAACEMQAAAPETPANAAAPAPAAPPPSPSPSPEPTRAADKGGDLKRWLTGVWSYDDSCGSDYAVRFDADGRIDNYGDIGRWKVEGDAVVQTITQTQELGMEPEPVTPPRVTRFTIARDGADSGAILFEGRRIPIKRC